MSRCRFCQESRGEVLETHHVIPRRYGGPDSSSNLVTVCGNCHSVLENIYNDDFFRELGVTTDRKMKREDQKHTVSKEIEDASVSDHIDILEQGLEGQDCVLGEVEVMEIVLSTMEQASEKAINGRIYDSENEKIRQDWVKQVGYLARSYSKMLSATDERVTAPIHNTDE